MGPSPGPGPTDRARPAPPPGERPARVSSNTAPEARASRPAVPPQRPPPVLAGPATREAACPAVARVHGTPGDPPRAAGTGAFPRVTGHGAATHNQPCLCTRHSYWKLNLNHLP